MDFVDVNDDQSRHLREQEAIAFIRESMPRTVQALITSKIDRLSADQQVVLKVTKNCWCMAWFYSSAMEITFVVVCFGYWHAIQR